MAIHRAKDSVVVKTEFSDATGTFRFDQLPTGSYFITASQVGYERVQRAPFALSSYDQKLPAIRLKPSGNRLRALPANSVEKIELITNPTARYNAAGSAQP